MIEIPLSGIKKIEEIVNSSNEYVSLSQGSIKIGGIPQQIKDYVQSLMKTDATDYYQSCWGIKPLREKLAEVIARDYDPAITVHNVLPTHGAIGGLSLLYLAILNPGDEVLIPEPSYPAYRILAMAARANTVSVSAFKQAEDGSYSWDLDLESIKKARTEKTKMLILSNPWNPIGVVLPPAKIKELLAWCEANQIFLVIDEAYRDYVFTPDYQSTLGMVTQSEWLISVSTFSKNMAMSGWRIGFLVIPTHLNKMLAGMQDALLNCLNNTSQYAALFALDHPEFSRKFHEIVLANRDITMQMLKPLVASGVISMTQPDGGFFAFIKTQHDDATDLVMSILNTAKVGLVPGGSFGEAGKPFFRICYARDTHLLQEGLSRLVNFLG